MKLSVSMTELTWNMVKSRLMAVLKADKQGGSQNQGTVLTYSGYRNLEELNKLVELLNDLPNHQISKRRPTAVDDHYPDARFQVDGALFELKSPEGNVLCVLQYWSFAANKEQPNHALKSYIMSLKV